jgi:hypothetical protein
MVIIKIKHYPLMQVFARLKNHVQNILTPESVAEMMAKGTVDK